MVIIKFSGGKKQMEEKGQKSKKCCYCGNFEGYYTKGLRRYEKSKQGFCSEHRKIVENQDCCECWKKNSKRHSARNRVASRALYEILMDISAIRQIIQENQEENKNS